MRNYLFILFIIITMPPSFAALGDVAGGAPRQAQQPYQQPQITAGIATTPPVVTLEESVAPALNSAFSVQQTRLPSGTTIREYANAHNILFAVAWEGPMLPDLHALFGHYYDDYLQLAQSAPSRLRHIAVSSKELVVVSHGHIRAFQGKAFLPELLPEGVLISQIK